MTTRFLTCLFLLPLICLSWGALDDESDERDQSVSYQCGPNEVLALYNQSSSGHYLITQPTPPVICGKTQTCTLVPGPCVAKFSYINEVQELPDGSAKTTCCLVASANGDESCQKIQVVDKTYYGTEGSEDQKNPGFLSGAGPLPSNSITKTRASRQAPAPQANGGTPAEITFKADLALFRVKDRRPPVQFLKDIQKTPNGYIVTLCTPSCSSTSTVSTRQPSTKLPTKEPHKQEDTKPEAVPKKSLFGGKLGSIGNGHGCFSGDMTVMTPGGKKRMDELHVGDEVLVLTSESEKKFQPIEWFYHRDTNQVIDYVNLRTKSGRHLSLTGNHMIPFVPCDSKKISLEELDKLVITSTQFAAKAKLGLCLATKLSDDTGFVADPIISVSTDRKSGVFSPITGQGTIMVNDIQTSCYSSVENQAVQRTVHSILIKANRAVQSIRELLNGKSVTKKSGMEVDDIPSTLAFLLEIGKFILPSHIYN